MKISEIRNLSDKVQKGDQKALSLLVEWGLDVEIGQNLDESRTLLLAWLRDRVELQRRRKSACKKAKDMRDKRTEKQEALVLTAIHTKRARLEREHRCFWTQILIEHYFDKRDIKAPDEELIRRVVRSFPGFL